MDLRNNPLRDILDVLYKQNDSLGKARNAYLLKEAERKHFESTLISLAVGKTHAEKSTRAQACDEWLDFHKALAKLESVYEFQKLKSEILSKEYQAQYLALKLDADLIKRNGE